jgi:hypothetical protein
MPMLPIRVGENRDLFYRATFFRNAPHVERQGDSQDMYLNVGVGVGVGIKGNGTER